MLLSSALFATSVSSSLDLAYAARYYFQGNRKSYYQIYLCNHKGTGRRTITNNKFNSYAPIWLDRSHLAWVEIYQPLPTSKLGEEPKAKMRVVVLDLRTNQRRKLAEVPPHEFFYPPYSRGNRFEITDHGPDLASRDTTYQVTLKGIQRVPNAEVEFVDGTEFGVRTNDDTLFPSRRIAIQARAGQWHLSWTIQEPRVSSDDDETVNKNWVTLKSDWKGKKTQFRFHGNKVKEAFVDASGNPIVHTVYAYEKYRHDDYVYRLSKDFSKSVEVTKRVGLVSFVKDRNLWVGQQPNLREGAMERLNDGRSVYVSWLYVGDWTSGRQWTIADGLVYVEGCVFRPKI